MLLGLNLNCTNEERDRLAELTKIIARSKARLADHIIDRYGTSHLKDEFIQEKIQVIKEARAEHASITYAVRMRMNESRC